MPTVACYCEKCGQSFFLKDELYLPGLKNRFQLEKTKIEVTTIKRYSEEFYLFALLGIIFLVLEILLRYTIFRTIP